MADLGRQGSSDSSTSSDGRPDSTLETAKVTPDPSDLELLAKLEEANRLIEQQTPTTPPTEAELLAKLEEANRLLAADKKSCLTPGHSRNSSLGGATSPISGGPRNGSSIIPSLKPTHSRNASQTSILSSNSTTSQHTEDEPSHPGGNLWEIWGKLVNDWGSAKKKPAFVKQLVRRGIPHPFRGLAWQLLLDVNNSPMKEMYVDYLKQKSPSERMIRRDIARTFPEHDFFKEKNGVGQESLFNVMKAYSLHDREVGYCQGSGFIVGLLLMQMPEEEAFAVLVKLMQDYRLRELFKPSMAELGLCMYKLECLIQEFLPDLYQHFQTQSFHTSMYASSWFLTLFATVVPLSVACRVMDLFISEGMDVIFRVGIAILQSSQTELLSKDMELMLQFFQKEIAVKFEADEEAFFTAAYQVRFNAKKLKRLEKEYTALKSKENEDQIELRRLRTENRLLRQRIDNLEKESASLADRLIQYQLTRAQEAEETYALKNELSLTKQRLTGTQKQLKEAESLIGDIKERTDSINSANSLDEGEAQVVVQGLQEELIMVRLKEAENSATIKNLRNKIEDLEQFNTKLQQAPSNDVQCLQEELIAVKLREAEANLSLKEMRQVISDLEANWQKHLSESTTPNSPRDKSSKSELKSELKKTQEEYMSTKLREAACLSHLKDTKQKVMELETQNQICSNQIKRMDEENKTQKKQLEEAAEREAELKKEVKTLLRKIDDIESKRREETMMARIREAESDQMIGELKQKMAAMEIQKEEVLAADRLESKGGTQELANTIFDLQEEVLQLKLSASPKSPQNSSGASPKSSQKEEATYDDDDDDDNDIEDPETLNRTLTEIIDGKRSSTSLLALLNREDTDSESIQSSSSSDNSSSIHKGGRLIRTPSLSSKTNGSDISSIPEVTCDLENAGENIENSAIDQFREVDLSAETGYELNSESVDKSDIGNENQATDLNGCRFSLEGGHNKHSAETVNQSDRKGQVKDFKTLSHNELTHKMNGEVPVEGQTAIDSNEQFSNHTNTSVVHKSEQIKDGRSRKVSDISTTNQT